MLRGEISAIINLTDSKITTIKHGNNGFNQRTSDMPQNLHLQDVVQDIGNEFSDNPFFNSDLDDNMGFSWKA